tara:strand:- start:2410 stop:3120 length:711 start_codon:yes stop_codon:yes gene_type:complete
MSLNYDDVEFGHVARTKDLSDGERMLTLMLSQLDELEYHINNALGSGVGNAKKVERKKPKGQKVSDGDVFGVQHTDKNSLSNKQLPRYAAKPNDVVTIPKPKIKKSRDFTGSSISKNGNWQEEEQHRDRQGFEEEEEPTEDVDLMLPVARAIFATKDAPKENPNYDKAEKMDEKEKAVQLANVGNALKDAKESLKIISQYFDMQMKEARTTSVPQSKVNVPQDEKPGIAGQLRRNI